MRRAARIDANRHKRPRRKSERQSKIEYLDKLHREIVLLQRGAKCQHCGRTTKLQGAHILPKGKYPRMRFVHENLLILCFPCHPEWWHKNPIESARWVSFAFPGLIERLYIWERQMPKLDLKELQVSLQIELAEEINLHSA